VTDPIALETLCCRLAAEAGRIAIGFRDERHPGRLDSGSLDQGSKSSPTDVVSAADLAAEHHIVSSLTRERPDDGLLGEEGAARPSSTGLTWVIDPVDGTTNFVYGRADWAVSVAVVDHGDDGDPLTSPAVAGAVAVPALGEVFSAARGRGARLRVNDHVVTLTSTPTSDLARALVATGFSYDAAHRSRQGARIARILGHVRDIRRSGSAAIDLCHVACGRVDAYVEDALNAWDVAAGVLICREAGARVTHAHLDRSRPLAVLATRPGLDAPLMELLASFEHE